MSTRPRLLPLSQHTTGPFFPEFFIHADDNDLTKVTAGAASTAQGQKIVLEGRVSILDDVPAVNSMLEIWQADAGGRFRHTHDPEWRLADPGFLGWGRTRTDREGRCRFQTVLPGGYTWNGASRAPHVNVSIWAAGLMRRVQTTLFFPESESANLVDPVFRVIPENLRSRVVMKPVAREAGVAPMYHFDIRLRGSTDETPFFED